MKAKILAALDKTIAEAETRMNPINPESYSNQYGVWKGLLRAREIVMQTEEEGAKHG